jgi:hypothetical protein
MNILIFVRILLLLLHVVMFSGEPFCLVQFPDSFVDVFHGCDAVASPFSASVLEVVAGALQAVTGSVDLGRYVALRGAWVQAGGWRDDHH